MGLHPFNGRVSSKFGGGLRPDDPYLSYYDTRLTQEDVNTIRDDDWLTDNVIMFWEEYLEHEKLTAYPNSNIVLLRPNVSHLLLRTPTNTVHNLGSALPDLKKTTHMFLTINDNRNPESIAGGTHWSLLVVSLIDGVAFHYDSLTPTNFEDARLLTYHLSLVTGTKLRVVSIEGTPQQRNGVDCGIHVCLMMQHLLLGKLLNQTSDQPINMSLADNDIDAGVGRKEMIKVIDSRRKEAQRMQSRSKSPLSRSGSRSPPRIGPGDPSTKPRDSTSSNGPPVFS